MKEMKKRNIGKKKLVIKTKYKGNNSPTPREESEDYISQYIKRQRLEKLNLSTYGDDLL